MAPNGSYCPQDDHRHEQNSKGSNKRTSPRDETLKLSKHPMKVYRQTLVKQPCIRLLVFPHMVTNVQVKRIPATESITTDS